MHSVVFAETSLGKSGWSDNFFAQAWQNLTARRKPIVGPLLVLQGEADPSIPFPVTTAGVKSTCTASSQPQLEYITFANVMHVPATIASQRTWVDCIEDRSPVKC